MSTPYMYLEFLADFSPEEEARYERRREERYDIPDPRYERWLGKKSKFGMFVCTVDAYRNNCRPQQSRNKKGPL